MGALVHRDVEIHTERTVHRGKMAAVDWSGKGFDHIARRYAPQSIVETADGVTIDAELQYVWSESGEVADSSPVRIELGIRDGLISSWRLFEERG